MDQVGSFKFYSGHARSNIPNMRKPRQSNSSMICKESKIIVPSDSLSMVISLLMDALAFFKEFLKDTFIKQNTLVLSQAHFVTELKLETVLHS